MKKASTNPELRELERIKKLLILQLSHQRVSLPNIAKAAEMSLTDIYKIIPKKRDKIVKK